MCGYFLVPIWDFRCFLFSPGASNRFVLCYKDNISGLTDAKSSEIFIDFNFQETSFTSNLKYLKIIGQSDFSDEVFYFDYIAANVGEEGLVWKKRLVSGSSAHLKYFVSKKEETICE